MRFLLLLLSMMGSLAFAAESPLVPLPSVLDVTDGDGFAFATGVSLEFESEYDGSDDYGLEAEPGGIIQWRRGNQVWFFEGQEFGWRGVLSDRWLLQAGGRFEGDREESEAPELAGLGDTDDEVMAMFEVRRGFGKNWQNWVAGRVMTGDSDIGSLGVLAVGRRFATDLSGEGIEGFLFTTFGTSEFINRDFGIDAQQSANSGLPVTDLSSGYRSIGIQFVGRWNFNRWQLLAEAGYEKYNSDISDSPISLDDFEAELGVSLLYTF